MNVLSRESVSIILEFVATFSLQSDFFNQIYSFLFFQTGSRWQHITNRCVVLESSHLLMLHEFERIALQKIALQKLNNSDLGVTTRIPKGEPAPAYSRNAL